MSLAPEDEAEQLAHLAWAEGLRILSLLHLIALGEVA